MPGVVVPRPRGRAGAGAHSWTRGGSGCALRSLPARLGARAGGGIRVEVPNFFAGKGERSRGTEAEGLGKRLMERALPPPPPQAGSHAVPAGLRSLFLMEMRGGGQEGGERSRLGHCGSPLPSPRSPPPPCGSLPAPSRPGGADPARGRGRGSPSAEQTKPAAAMRGAPGPARRGGQDGAPGWSGGPPGQRRGPLVPKRQAITPPPPQPPSPQSRRSERHRLGGELVLGLLIMGGEPGGLWGEEVRRMRGGGGGEMGVEGGGRVRLKGMMWLGSAR